jgi:hypothetical protein
VTKEWHIDTPRDKTCRASVKGLFAGAIILIGAL